MADLLQDSLVGPADAEEASPSAPAPHDPDADADADPDDKDMTLTNTHLSDPNQLDPNDELKLQFRWALWYSAPKDPDQEKKWEKERAKKIVEFETIQEFWSIFNNLCAPSKLQEGADMQLFRAGVQPQWEDAFNAKGGAWTLRLRASSEDNDYHARKLDSVWYNTVLTVIGDNFDDADDICGIYVSLRAKMNRVQLWTKHADDREAVTRIGKQFKEVNHVRSPQRIVFQSHEDAKSADRKPADQMM